MPESVLWPRAKSGRKALSDAGIAAHHYPQFWLLIVSFALFGIYVAWDLGVIRLIFALDRSYITSLIAALVLFSTCHAAWHIFAFSRYIEEARRCIEIPEGLANLRDAPGLIGVFAQELEFDPAGGSPEQRPPEQESDSVVEIFADRLRSPVELGWFLVDLAVRMGLVGTIIGFILIFTSLSGSTISAAEGLQDLLVSMSGGMGTALFTTLTGLVGATLLSFQYLLLGREAQYLIGLLVRIRNRRAGGAEA